MSFTNVKKWIKLMERTRNPLVVRAMIGNKIDIDKSLRLVTTEEAEGRQSNYLLYNSCSDG